MLLASSATLWVLPVPLPVSLALLASTVVLVHPPVNRVLLASTAQVSVLLVLPLVYPVFLVNTASLVHPPVKTVFLASTAVLVPPSVNPVLMASTALLRVLLVLPSVSPVLLTSTVLPVHPHATVSTRPQKATFFSLRVESIQQVVKTYISCMLHSTNECKALILIKSFHYRWSN